MFKKTIELTDEEVLAFAVSTGWQEHMQKTSATGEIITVDNEVTPAMHTERMIGEMIAHNIYIQKVKEYEFANHKAIAELKPEITLK